MKIQNLDFNDAATMMRALNETVSYIRSKTGKKPQIAIVLGSGMGDYAAQLRNADVIPYEEIPNFPRPAVAGHSGKLFIGEVAGKCVAVMQGRNHYYEGCETQAARPEG
jgi:purine-nucleoside phosphorylase